MITRFRLEARADSKEQVLDELDTATVKIQEMLRGHIPWNHAGDWECTDEVIYQEKRFKHASEYRGEVGRFELGYGPQEATGFYKGRRVMRYHPDGI